MVDLSGSSALVIGGHLGAYSTTSEVWSFDQQAGWQQAGTDVPIPKSYLNELNITRPVLTGITRDLVLLYADTAAGGQTWTYDPAAEEWQLLTETTVRKDSGLSHAAFDSESGQLIVFGGRQGPDPGVSNETWAYDLSEGTFTQMDPPVSPDGRFGAAMDYDAGSDRVVLFGGWSWDGPGSEGHFGDTWAYDFNTDTWTEMAPDKAPPPTSHATMAYDPVGDTMILFGGEAGEGLTSAQDTTWSYDLDSNAWVELAPGRAPSARELASMVYEADSRTFVLFGGGWISSGETLSDTWIYDPAANTWTEWTAP